MTARSGQSAGAQWFTSPQQVNQRRYEALRAYFTEGLTYEQAGARFGYTRWAMINLVRDWRAGKLELFAEAGRPGRKSAPRKNAARGRVVELRRQGLSVYETVINAETGAAITTEQLRYGVRVAVLAIACHPIWRTPQGLRLAGPAHWGFEHQYVPIAGSFPPADSFSWTAPTAYEEVA